MIYRNNNSRYGCHLVTWKLMSYFSIRYNTFNDCSVRKVVSILLSVEISRYNARLSYKRGGGYGWYPINWFNPLTYLCLSHARTWISNVICCGVFVLMDWGGSWFCILLILVEYCWPSLFKLSFHRFSYTIKQGMNFIFIIILKSKIWFS